MTSRAGKKPRSYYNLNNRSKKQNKPKEWLKQKKVLEKRMEAEGETKWLKNAVETIEKRLKKANMI